MDTRLHFASCRHGPDSESEREFNNQGIKIMWALLHLEVMRVQRPALRYSAMSFSSGSEFFWAMVRAFRLDHRLSGFPAKVQSAK